MSYAFAPDLSVSPDGTLHILWHPDGSGTIRCVRSIDGGETFGPVQTVVTGVQSLRGHLPETHGWPHFDHGRFRVITLATSCAGSGGVIVVAWADMREGRSRIYYRRSVDAGMTWLGPAVGQPLLPNVSLVIAAALAWVIFKASRAARARVRSIQRLASRRIVPTPCGRSADCGRPHPPCTSGQLPQRGAVTGGALGGAGGRHLGDRVLGQRGDRQARVHTWVGGQRRAVGDQ